MKEFISRGLYSVSDASRILSLKRNTIIRWTFGYNRRGKHYDGVTHAEVPDLQGRHALTFRELVQLLSVREFLKAGAKWPQIHSAYLNGCEKFGTTYPFARKHWFADPGGIYYGSDEDLIEMSSAALQGAMKKTLALYLHRMDFDTDGLAERWYPLGRRRAVVLDPAISFGAPVVKGTGIRTDTLRGLQDAGEGVKSLAWWYNIKPTQVAAALDFEQALTAF